MVVVLVLALVLLAARVVPPFGAVGQEGNVAGSRLDSSRMMRSRLP